MRGYSEDTGFGLGGWVLLVLVVGLLVGLLWRPAVGGAIAGVGGVLFPVWLLRTLIRWVARQWHHDAPKPS